MAAAPGRTVHGTVAVPLRAKRGWTENRLAPLGSDSFLTEMTQTPGRRQIF